jgi:hypothetical protein
MIVTRVEILLRIFAWHGAWEQYAPQGYIHYLDTWDAAEAETYYQELVKYIGEVKNTNAPN